ncbi:MAG: glycosyltransferase family 2 protein [Atopobiaceae bacterium]|nr:glycosyltransferase family 2 protein [Atopobiaceae bacterium]
MPIGTKSYPMVSVIIPAYNVEGYVARALESMQRQTFTDFEMLVVDDGSTDRTGDIIRQYTRHDLRIVDFHTENGGAPAARNLALNHARGKYVYFMDADDWAEPSMLADMVAMAERDHLELAVAGFYIDTYYGNGSEYTTELKSRPTATYPTQHEFRVAAAQLFDQNLLYPPWNKLFLRERIERLGLRFRDTFWDDFPFVLDFIRDVERVGVTEHAYYHFIRQREESETARWRPDMYQKREEEHTWMLDLYNHWGLDGDPASMEVVQRRYIERLIGCIENVCNPSCDLSQDEKISTIEEMIGSERAQIAVVIAQPRSRMMKTMLVPIKKQNAKLAYREGCIISFVKTRNTRVFATLKARR